MEITLSIIGTAGRKDDEKRLSANHFRAMCVIAEGLIEQIGESNYTITHLVSGGAAWADHVAVRLFLDKKVPRLRLFLPATWEGGSFHDTGDKEHYKNPGGTANYYHKRFQEATGINSLTEIHLAKMEGAELIEVQKGFYARNALVAKSDFLLACTFGHEHEVKTDEFGKGGTADTVRKYLARVHKEGSFDKSFHYDLNSGMIYEGCTVPPLREDGKRSVKQLARRIGIPTTGIISVSPPYP